MSLKKIDIINITACLQACELDKYAWNVISAVHLYYSVWSCVVVAEHSRRLCSRHVALLHGCPASQLWIFLFFFIAGRHNRQRWLRRDNINAFAGFLGTLRLIVVDCLKKKKRKLWWKVEDSLGTFSDTSKKGTVCSPKALEQSLSTPLVHIVLYEIFVFIREHGCHRGHIFML